jgi:hypothetical protein
MIEIAGIIIRENAQLVDKEKWVQVHFPKSKKKRIRKKWAWRDENWGHPPLDRGLFVGGVIYCHPKFAAQLRDELAAATGRALG